LGKNRVSYFGKNGEIKMFEKLNNALESVDCAFNGHSWQYPHDVPIIRFRCCKKCQKLEYRHSKKVWKSYPPMEPITRRDIMH
jgi:hypothetical protein